MDTKLMDTKYMYRAMELAEKGRGRTNPNPLVGAVVVRDGKITGEGYHEFIGGPHAEINALKQAGDKARGATVFVTLEPCCFHGRTPPCTEALKKAGIGEVVIGLEDPNPRVSGRGIDELRKEDISVEVGLLSEKIASQNEVYVKYITTGYPFVLMKAAMSLDGKIAKDRNRGMVISNQKSREAVHILRDQYDAIVVGIGTICADDPLLTARIKDKQSKNPLRVVVDSTLRIPIDSRIVETAEEVETLVVCAKAREDKERLLRDKGIEVLEIPGKNGMVDLAALLKELGRREISSVLWEGGSRLNAAALSAGIVDKVLLFVAPILIGSQKASGLVDGSFEKADRIYQLCISNTQMIEGDLVVEAYPTNRK